MSTDIITKFKSLNIAITPALAKHLDRIVLQYEIRKDHPLVLNSPTLGVDKISFTTNDRSLLFDICDIYESDVASLVKTIDAIDNSFKVASDPMNLLCIYLVYLTLNSKLASKPKDKLIQNILMYWQYRFFSSIVNHYYPHGAHDDIMRQVIENLSLKYEIKVLGTWKKVFRAKAASLIERKSIHAKTLHTMKDDKAVLYVITDVQTRMRSRLKNITALYHDTKESNDYIRSSSSSIELDGKQIIKESESGYELVSHHIFTKMISKSAFMNPKYIDMLLVVQKTVSKGILNRLFNQMSDIAALQTETEIEHKLIKRRNGAETYIGLALLTEQIIRVIYDNVLTDDRININNRLEIFNATKTLFSTHRSNNAPLINTKASIQFFIKDQRITRRENTLSTLSISVALYFTLLSFDFL